MSESQATENPAKPSASIILLRDGDQGVELFVVRRNQQMRFAAGATAFPGGALDQQDIDFANRLNSGDEILPFRINAIRELFEETGMLFAADSAGNLLSAKAVNNLSHYRELLVSEQLSFEQFLAQENLTLMTNKLVHFACWVAPEIVEHRFATDFFLAPQPSDQQSEPDTGELDAAYWSPLTVLMNELRNGEISMLFPTEMNCLRLMQHQTVAEIFAAVRQPAPVIYTTIEQTADEIMLCTPPEAEVGLQKRQLLR